MTGLVPAEWEEHAAMWLGFPSHEDLWQSDLIAAQAEVASLARLLAEVGGEKVKLLVDGHDAHRAARSLLGEVSGMSLIDSKFGDIWLRDTGPIYVRRAGAEGEGLWPACFRNNGWGGKYPLAHDDTVASRISEKDGYAPVLSPFILEGGALDHDGFGTVLTTRQCLLNPNRNPGWDEARAEAELKVSLGVRKVIWVDKGLLNDHTDGHIDNLARFVAPGVVACPVAFGENDPNSVLYDQVARHLAGSVDARGQALQIVRVPSPGCVRNDDGEVVPASHMNFLIGNDVVAVPVYDKAAGELAVEVIQSLFPERKVFGLSSRAILTGGGSFHCITQQVPMAPTLVSGSFA